MTAQARVDLRYQLSGFIANDQKEPLTYDWAETSEVQLHTFPVSPPQCVGEDRDTTADVPTLLSLLCKVRRRSLLRQAEQLIDDGQNAEEGR